jgi:hypothetical protein
MPPRKRLERLTTVDLERVRGGENFAPLPVDEGGRTMFPEGTHPRAMVNYGRCKQNEERAGRAAWNVCDEMVRNAAKDGRRFAAMAKWGDRPPAESIWKR